jgi:hypothetical protein
MFCFRHNEINAIRNKGKVMPNGSRYEPISASIYDAECLINKIDEYIENLAKEDEIKIIS